MAGEYFSVRFSMKVLGARYIPAVCYKLDGLAEPTIRELASKGDAAIYAEKVRFVNGKPVPFAKARPFSSAPVPAAAEPVQENKKKKGRRNFD